MSFNRRVPTDRNNRGRISSGGAPSDPTPITLLGPARAWWRPDPVAITLNVSDVSAFADRSGNAHHVLQATPSKQPLWTASDANLNGQPSVTFTSANTDFLECATGGLDGNFDHSIFAVLYTNTIINAFTGWASYGRSVAGVSSSIVGERNGNQFWFGGGGTVGASGGVTASNTKYRVGKIHTGTSTQGYVAGATAGAPVVTTYTLAVSPGFIINARDSGTAFGNISLAEVVIFDRALSAPEIATLDGYFTARYGA